MVSIGALWDESVNETVRENINPIAFIFEWLTHLGDGAFLLVLGVLIYWFGARENRRNRAFVIAVGTAALALSAGLKGIVQLPRPELVFAPATYPGYSFPSAHAMGSAAFYGSIAVTMTRGHPHWRYLLAGVVIVTISISRVILGLHYVGDVLFGSLLGIALVGIGVWFREEDAFDPGPLFVLAAIIATLAMVAGSRVFLSLTIGASIGGIIGWSLVKNRPTTSIGAGVLVLGAGAIVGILALRTISIWLGLTAIVPTNSRLIFLGELIGYTLLTIYVMLVPWLAMFIEDNRLVIYLQQRLPFRGRIIEPEPSSEPVRPDSIAPQRDE